MLLCDVSLAAVLLTLMGWFAFAIPAFPKERSGPDGHRVHPENLAVSGSNQAYRAISTSQLKALPLLHLWPIDVVVFHGPQGDLVLKGASRLDAFSGYPVRT